MEYLSRKRSANDTDWTPAHEIYPLPAAHHWLTPPTPIPLTSGLLDFHWFSPVRVTGRTSPVLIRFDHFSWRHNRVSTLARSCVSAFPWSTIPTPYTPSSPPPLLPPSTSTHSHPHPFTSGESVWPDWNRWGERLTRRWLVPPQQ